MIDGIRLAGLAGVELTGVWVTGASRWGVALDRVRGAAVISSWMEDNRYGGLGLTTTSDVLVIAGLVGT